jgi:hypothetical protein
MVSASSSRPVSLTGYIPELGFDEPQKPDQQGRRWTLDVPRTNSELEEIDSMLVGDLGWTTASPIKNLEEASFVDAFRRDRLIIRNEKVLESFRGRVLNIDAGIAYVELKNINGERFSGQYSSEELQRRGIERGDYFDCKTITKDGTVSVAIERVEGAALSSHELAEIARNVADAIQGLK